VSMCVVCVMVCVVCGVCDVRCVWFGLVGGVPFARGCGGVHVCVAWG
jgi:hypothetical protein